MWQFDTADAHKDSADAGLCHDEDGLGYGNGHLGHDGESVVQRLACSLFSRFRLFGDVARKLTTLVS